MPVNATNATDAATAATAATFIRACPEIATVGALVFGVGHSGTSTVACILANHGRRPFRGDRAELCEHRHIVRINQQYMTRALGGPSVWRSFRTTKAIEAFLNASTATQRAPERSLRKAAMNLVPKLAKPYVIKDPRLIFSLHVWATLPPPRPALVHVHRPLDALLKTYACRHVRHNNASHIKTRILWAARQLARWPGCSVSFDIQNVPTAEANRKNSGRGCSRHPR